MKRIICLAISVILTITLCSCENSNKEDETAFVMETFPETTEATTEPPENIPEDSIVHIVAAGDNLIHSSIYNQAKRRSQDDGYDFDFAYKHIEPLIEGCDIGILNQETIIANDMLEPSDYPRFNSPTQVGDKMISLGFNAFCHANNHILDRGEEGLLYTLDYWDSTNQLVYGAYRNEQELQNIKTKTINGIKFSFLGFTDHTNGLYLPQDSDAVIVDTEETDKMKQLIQKANSTSDVVIVSVHWGNEYWNEVTDIQKNLARDFTNWGADIILGTHPHAVQTMEYIDNIEGKQAFVAYSLGNFISAMDKANTMVGLVLDLDVVRNGQSGDISIENVKAKPVITHYGYNYSNIEVYPYYEYNDDLASKHGLNSKEEFSMEVIDNILNTYIPKEFLYLEK